MKLVLGCDAAPPPPPVETDRCAGTEQPDLGADGKPRDVEPREDPLHD
jgi:hypothetical protein